MRGKIILGTLVAAMFIMGGCSAKEAVIDETAEKNVTKPMTETTETTTVASDMDKSELQMLNAESGIASIYFDFDIFTIRKDMLSTIEKNSKLLNNDDNKKYRIKIEGNCDEWGTDEYNYALGLKRASSTKKAIMGEGVDEDRITIVSYGEANPKCTEKTRSCWAENRRADFKIRP